MGYCLKPDELPAAGFRRIAREQLQGALREIAGTSGAEAPAAIHATRKHIKRIRALIHLVRGQLGDEVFKEENRQLRDVARSFSGSRDAFVRVQVLEQLGNPIGDEGSGLAQTRLVLDKEFKSLGVRLNSKRREAEAVLVGMSDRVEGWPLDGLGMEPLCCALKNTYRSGRKCFGYATRDPNPEEIHSVRKRVKHLWYQARILQQLNRVVLCELVNEAKALARYLGSLHDLSSFHDWVEKTQELPEEECAVLRGLICIRDRDLETIALDLGARFFAEKPGVFERRLLRYARKWPASA
jgi:CHAD domain-containing protein